MSVAAALERLAAALRGAGVNLWQPPSSTAPIELLQDAVSPMVLPDELVAFWNQVDVRTLNIEPWPRFVPPDFALDTWLDAKRDFRAFQPLALVLVGYESHDCMSIELNVGDVKGGALFAWSVSDPSGFTRQFNALADYLAHMAALVENGVFDRGTSRGELWLTVPHPDEDQRAAAMLPTPDAHPVYGATRHIGPDLVDDWPPHWQWANGLLSGGFTPSGATHTISELLSGGPNGQRQITVAARVIDLMASSAFTRVRVDDGTGTLDIHCPRETRLVGPRLGCWYEFDVVMSADPRQAPPYFKDIASGLDAQEAGLGADFMKRFGAAAPATATAIRRLPQPG